jgi:hypothetical protein
MANLSHDVLCVIADFTYGPMVQLVYQGEDEYHTVFIPYVAFNLLRSWQVNTRFVIDPRSRSVRGYSRLRKMPVTEIDAMSRILNIGVLGTLPGFADSSSWFVQKTTRVSIMTLFADQFSDRIDLADRRVFQQHWHGDDDVPTSEITLRNLTPGLIGLFSRICDEKRITYLGNLNLAQFPHARMEQISVSVIEATLFTNMLHDTKMRTSTIYILTRRHPNLTENDISHRAVYVDMDGKHYRYSENVLIMPTNFASGSRVLKTRFNIWIDKDDIANYLYYKKISEAVPVQYDVSNDGSFYMYSGKDYIHQILP